MLNKIEQYIKKWESQGYPNGIPDEADSKLESLNKAPSYRAICKAILSNDNHLTSLGFSRPSCYSYGVLKRVELEERKNMLNVYQATIKRLEIVFSEFDNVYVSFSGGKDSGVLLNLCIDFIRKNYPGRKLGVFHIDYEAQYQMTTDYVDLEFSKNSDVLEIYRICLPIAAQCATSAHTNHWIPWDRDKKDLWVRDMPAFCISEMNHEFDWFKKGMWDYDLQERFSKWIHKKKNAKKTACLVGIRTDESLNRWRAIHSDKNKNKYEGHEWTLEMSEGVYNAYPIFDWKVDDIWIANYKQQWDYNKLYDLFWKAGLSPAQMRVASPFNDAAMESLKLYKVIDPRNWGKMIGRTNGVNFAGIYGGTTAMGWKSIKLPKGHTWKSYMEFLLSTLPKSAADNYRKKLEASKKSWLVGGAVDKETIKQLKKEKAPMIRTGKTNNRGAKDKEVIIFKDYLDDTTVDNFRRVPTYKRMCICIMKNDHTCKYMGFAQTKTETELRNSAEERYAKINSNKKDN